MEPKTKKPLDVIKNNGGPITIVTVMLALAGFAKFQFEAFAEDSRASREALYRIIADAREDAKITRQENRASHEKQWEGLHRVREGLNNVAVALARIEAKLSIPLESRPPPTGAAIVPPLELPPRAEETKPRIAKPAQADKPRESSGQ